MSRARNSLPAWARRLTPTQAALVLVVAVVALLVTRGCEKRTPGSLEDARARQASDVWIETTGRVKRLLPDDRKDVPHQRILLDTGDGTTLLVVHNLDLADRVPAREGDTLEVRGEYVWNERGGLVHWTHHDPSGRREGGWITHGGRTYR